MAKNEQSNNKGAALGVAAAVAAAAAAGAYWFYGSEDASKHRKQVKSFMFKARAEVLDAVEKMRDIDRDAYLRIVDKVVGRYAGMAGVTAQEIAQMTRDLRAAWGHMKAARELAAVANRSAPKRRAKKSAAKKRAAKKKS